MELVNKNEQNSSTQKMVQETQENSDDSYESISSSATQPTGNTSSNTTPEESDVVTPHDTNNTKETVPHSSSGGKSVSFSDTIQVWNKASRTPAESNAVDSTVGPSSRQSKRQAYGHQLQKLAIIAKSKESVQEQLKQRGATLVEDKTLFETPVKIEFNIGNEATEFNAREELIILVKKMQLLDELVRIKTSNNAGLEWSNLEDIPENEYFLDCFQLKEFSFRTHRKVLLHMSIT